MVARSWFLCNTLCCEAGSAPSTILGGSPEGVQAYTITGGTNVTFAT